MSDYVVESGTSARARARRRRAAVTLLVLVALLFGAFWYAYSYFRSDAGKATATSCPTVTATKVVAVTVNVYNATGRTGLAATTAEALKKRGFTIGTVANDPLKKSISGSAEVRYGPKGASVAPQVVALVPKPASVVDKRTTADVDLVLGEGYQALSPAPKTATPTTSATCG